MAHFTSPSMNPRTAHTIMLIQKLVDPEYARDASGISQQLLDMQASAGGWTVADDLVCSEDATLQFYGALTFQVKLNRQGKALGKDDGQAILGRLLNAFHKACLLPNSPLNVLDKLCGALSTFLVQLPSLWENALDCASLTLLTGNAVVEMHNESTDVIPLGKLSERQVVGLTRLAKTMIEEINKIESNSLSSHRIILSFDTNLPTFTRLMEWLLQARETLPQQLLDDVLSAWAAAAAYTLSHLSRQADHGPSLQHLSGQVLAILQSPDISRVYKVADAVAGVLKDYKTFILAEQYDLIWSALQQAQDSCQDRSSEENLPLLRLACAWGRARMWALVKDPRNATHRALAMQMTRAIFDVSWAEDGAEQLYVAMDFWDSFAEVLFELNEYDDALAGDTQWQRGLLAIVEPFLQASLDALDPKPEDDMASIDPDDVEDYHRLRLSFSDIVGQLVGTNLLPIHNFLADQLEPAVAQGQWFRVEAIFHLLADVEREYEPTQANEAAMSRIFRSDLLAACFQTPTQPQRSPRLKRRLVAFIDSYGFFVKQQKSLIPLIITYLMTTLDENAAANPKLSDRAARSMASICFACRAELVGQIDALMEFCGRALADARLSAYQREKIYSSITSVVMALPNEAAMLQPLSLVIGKIHEDIQSGKSKLATGIIEEAEQDIVTALNCLVAVSKSVIGRSQNIELPNELVGSGSTAQASPWDSPEGQQMATSMLDCISIMEAVPRNGDAWDAVCAILRAGLTEAGTGPFTFSPQLISSFLQNVTLDHPRVETMLTTACTFVSSQTRANTSKLTPHDDETDLVVPLTRAIVVNVVLALGPDPNADPAVMQLAMDYLERLLPKHAHALILQLDPTIESSPPSSSRLNALLQMVLSSFTTSQPITLKRATASFVSTLLLLPTSLATAASSSFNSSTLPPSYNHDNSVKYNDNDNDNKQQQRRQHHQHLLSCTQSIIASFLGPVAAAIAQQVGGQAQRSELDAISRVLRSWVQAAGPRARMLLEEAICGPLFPHEEAKATDGDKRAFVARIELLRGGRGTADAVRDFWAKSRGTVAAFR